jgi:hypothetical protein
MVQQVAGDLAQIVGVFDRTCSSSHQFSLFDPVSLRISANHYGLCVTTNSILPTFLLPLQAVCAQHCDLVALLPVCLSELTTFAKSNELLSYQAMDMVFLLLQRRFSTLRPLKGYCIQSPKSRDDTATLLLVACPDRVPWSRSNLVDFLQPWLFTFLHIG